MDVVREDRLDTKCVKQYVGVSILVLMDVVREGLPDKILASQSSRRFNPCSNGCRSGSGQAGGQYFERIRFQSLF